jgi:hypothetical protein
MISLGGHCSFPPLTVKIKIRDEPSGFTDLCLSRPQQLSSLCSIQSAIFGLPSTQPWLYASCRTPLLHGSVPADVASMLSDDETAVAFRVSVSSSRSALHVVWRWSFLQQVKSLQYLGPAQFVCRLFCLKTALSKPY